MSTGPNALAQSYIWPLITGGIGEQLRGSECSVFDTSKRLPSVIVAQWGDNSVWRINISGKKTRINSDTFRPGFGGDKPVNPKKIKLNTPVGCALTSKGEFIFAENGNHRIRRISANGSTITTIAGSGPVDDPSKEEDAGVGNGGFAGDGGPATKARLNHPRGLALTPQGEIVFADFDNNRIRKIDRQGIITTIAGTGVAGFNGETGQGTTIQLNKPTGVAVNSAGEILIADKGNARVRLLLPDGTIRTVVSKQPGLNTVAIPHLKPRMVAWNQDGSFLIAEDLETTVDRVSLSAGTFTTLAGKPGNPELKPDVVYGDGGPASKAFIRTPVGLTVTPDGGIIVALFHESPRFIGPEGDAELGRLIRAARQARNQGKSRRCGQIAADLRAIARSAERDDLRKLRAAERTRNGRWLSKATDYQTVTAQESPSYRKQDLAALSWRIHLALNFLGTKGCKAGREGK